MPHALLVDDHPDTLEALSELVRAENFTVAAAGTIDQAKIELARQRPDVVLVDLNLPDGSGMSLLDAFDNVVPSVVLITGHASLDTAIQALRRGVTDYLTKPLDIERLRQILGDIARTSQLPEEISDLKRRQAETGKFRNIVGRSAQIQQVCSLIGRIAPSSAGVLISGESGTGKDVVARTIHELSRRRHSAFVAVNCGAISPSLMESELFGHERGSFTGADRRHKGVFERAHRGTLFLDEITEMPIELQVKLLRVLETGTLSRVGGEELISVDVRILASTNRNVQQAIADGKLREDLYYRLKVFHLELPPLREHPEDVPLLVQHVLDELERSEGVRKPITEAALSQISAHQWPGNVRELLNVVHSAFILAGSAIDVDSLPPELQPRLETGPRPAARDNGTDIVRALVGMPLAEVERRLITATLARCEGRKVQAAALLGISLKTLYNRLNTYELSSQKDRSAPKEPHPQTQ